MMKTDGGARAICRAGHEPVVNHIAALPLLRLPDIGPFRRCALVMALGVGLAFLPNRPAVADFFDDIVQDTTDYLEQKVEEQTHETIDEALEPGQTSSDEAEQPPAQDDSQPAVQVQTQTSTDSSAAVHQVEMTMEAQDRLNQLGYNAGPVDGQAGAKTAAAIIAFQQDHGLAPDGAVTEDLVSALRAAEGEAPVSAAATAQDTDQSTSPTQVSAPAGAELSDTEWAAMAQGNRDDIIEIARMLANNKATKSAYMEACLPDGVQVARSNLVATVSSLAPQALDPALQYFDEIRADPGFAARVDEGKDACGTYKYDNYAQFFDDRYPDMMAQLRDVVESGRATRTAQTGQSGLLISGDGSLNSELSVLIDKMAINANIAEICYYDEAARDDKRADLVAFLSEEWPSAISWSQSRYDRQYATVHDVGYSCAMADAEFENYDYNDGYIAEQKAMIVQMVQAAGGPQSVGAPDSGQTVMDGAEAAPQEQTVEVISSAGSPSLQGGPVTEEEMSLMPYIYKSQIEGGIYGIAKLMKEKGVILEACQADGMAVAQAELGQHLAVTSVPYLTPKAESIFEQHTPQLYDVQAGQSCEVDPLCGHLLKLNADVERAEKDVLHWIKVARGLEGAGDDFELAPMISYHCD